MLQPHVWFLWVLFTYTKIAEQYFLLFLHKQRQIIQKQKPLCIYFPLILQDAFHLRHDVEGQNIRSVESCCNLILVMSSFCLQYFIPKSGKMRDGRLVSLFVLVEYSKWGLKFSERLHRKNKQNKKQKTMKKY